MTTSPEPESSTSQKAVKLYIDEEKLKPNKNNSKMNKSTLVIYMSFLQLQSSFSYSLMSPFYPVVAKQKGIAISTIGYIIGTFAFVSMFSCLCVGYLLKRVVGAKTVISICTCLIVVSTFIMGYIKGVQDINAFIGLSFLAQILGGIGAGGNSTVTLATLSQFDNHEREKYIGWLEGAFGLGFILGPLLGALLYSVGGY